MATQIVKPEDKFALTLASLQTQSASIAVKTPEDCLTSKTMQRDVRNYMKDVHLKLDPFVESAKRNLAEAKDELNKWLNPDEAAAVEKRKAEQKSIEEARKAGELNKRQAEKMRKEAEERERAAKEQAEKDAELVKASVTDVEVKPNIPTVAGVPSRRNWKFRVLDATRIPRAYLMPNEVKIGADVRFLKNKLEAESKIPGIECWEE